MNSGRQRDNCQGEVKGQGRRGRAAGGRSLLHHGAVFKLWHLLPLPLCRLPLGRRVSRVIKASTQTDGKPTEKHNRIAEDGIRVSWQASGRITFRSRSAKA